MGKRSRPIPMPMISILSLGFVLLSFTPAFAQSQVLSYAHYVIDTLTSPVMDGRGYVDSSDYKAATFIQHEFRMIDLQSFTENYFQPIYFDVNTFPGEMELELNGKKLIPGKDFLVDAGSNTLNGKFPAIRCDLPQDTSLQAVAQLAKTIKNKKKLKSSVLFFDRQDFNKMQYAAWHRELLETNCFGAKGCIEFTNNKLTWDASEDVFSFCYVQVYDSTITDVSKATFNIQNQWKKNYKSQNVAGYVSGTEKPDSFIVFTSHYDHLGQMGDGIYFPGANDNASGTSMVLNLAKYYKQHPSKYSIAFICFSGEELGLVGSVYYVEHPLFPLTKIKFLINLDIVGTGDEGIKVVNATEFPRQFDDLVKLNEREQLLKVVSPRGKAANSDHYPFYQKGVPCFFIYTMGGISAYHDIYDRAATLPLTKYENLFKLLVDFTGEE